MFGKRARYWMVLVVLSVCFLYHASAEAADYQLAREGTKMTCVDKQTGQAVVSKFVQYKGNTYYFDAKGYAHTGWLRKGKDCYFFRANGTMLKKQWMRDYYFLANGKMARSRWVTKSAYVGKDGRVIPGYKRRARAGFVNTEEGKKYRNYDGSYVTHTWQCIKGHWYYFYSNGVMASQRQIGKFYVDRQGRMVVSKWIRIGSKKYYYGPDGRLKRKQKVKTVSKKK